MSTASASATEVGRVRPTEKYWTDYEDWKVRPTTREERRERRERSSKTKEKASLSVVSACGGRFSLLHARGEVSRVFLFFFFSQPSRARTELHDADTRPPKEKNERS